MQLLLELRPAAPPCGAGRSTAAAELTVRERARFFGHVHPEDLLAPAERCWRWVGMRDGDGRPQISMRGRHCTATRIAYAAPTGRLPDPEEFVVHTCATSDCVNPRHLRVVAVAARSPAEPPPAPTAGRVRATRQTPLTDEEVRAVADEARAGATVRDLHRRWRLDARALKRVLALAERMAEGRCG
jgi:hypothetical protein